MTDSKTKEAEETPLGHTTTNLQDLFDDGIYGKGYMPPPVTKSSESSRTCSPYQHTPRTPSPYQQPPSAKDNNDIVEGTEVSKTKKRSSMERLTGGLVKVPSLKKKTESRDNLLEDDDDSDDYDDVIVNVSAVAMAQCDDTPPPPRPAPTHDQSHTQYRDDEIYGNLPYTKEGGAVGNAGERWESYWKTQTLLRSPDHGQSSLDTGEKKLNTPSSKKK